jgi:glycosyltransferase involved in cell wall biosynthesis
MNNKIEATVIIPTYNRITVLKSCLQKLIDQTTENFEILLIDDCSSDGTKEYIKSSDFPNLKYIRLKEHLGPYYARNLAIRQAKGEIIIFIDSDVIVFPDFVEDHIKIHKKREDLVLQGMVKHVKSLKDVNMNRLYIPNALCLRTFITQNASVRRKYLIATGGFDRFGPEMGYKDIDMGLKLMNLGLKWSYGIKKCKAFHIDGKVTEKSISSTFSKWTKQGASAYYFVKKWGRRGEKYARTKKALFFSRLLHTDKWIEKENIPKMIVQSKKNIGLAAAVLKGIARYHYRSKGIKKARNKESFSNSSNIQ